MSSRSSKRTQLVGKIGVVDQRDSPFVPAAQQDPPELGLGGGHASGKHERGVAQVEERHLAAILDAPAVAQGGWKAGLPPLGDAGDRGGGRHRHIVREPSIQGTRPVWAARRGASNVVGGHEQVESTIRMRGRRGGRARWARRHWSRVAWSVPLQEPVGSVSVSLPSIA